jgi:hypothetical protein
MSEICVMSCLFSSRLSVYFLNFYFNFDLLSHGETVCGTAVSDVHPRIDE